MKNNSKKTIYILVGGFVILTLVAIFLGFQQTSQKKVTTSVSESVSPTNAENSAVVNQPATAVYPVTPEGVAKAFYAAYTATPDPIATKAYKTPYSSAELIRFVEKIYKGKNDPVFCTQNRTNLPNFIAPTYSSDGKTAYVYITRSDQKKLYNIELDMIAGKWLVANVECLP
jgi:hypothetical protein